MKWSSAKGILFDLDGLLLDSERVSCECWLQAAQEHQISVHDIYPKLIGRGAAECDRILTEQLGIKAPVSVMRARKNELFDRHVDTIGIPLKRGAQEIVGQAKAVGKYVALATGSTKCAATRKLKGHDTLRQLFDVEVFGDDVKHGKPCPDIFFLAASRLKLSPGECLVLDDSIAGMQAARAAAIPAIIVPDLVPIEMEMGDTSTVIVKSLVEALALLKLG